MIFSGFSILNMVLSVMAGLALQEGDIGYARFLSDKVQSISRTLEMGKYHEYSSILDIVCVGKDAEGTYKVVKQLLANIETMYDFRESRLYKHMKFQEIDSSVFEVEPPKNKVGSVFFKKTLCLNTDGHFNGTKSWFQFWFRLL